MDDPDFTNIANARIAIIGLGLMGGSLALAIKDHCKELIGVETDSASRAFAQQHNLVQRTTNFNSAQTDSDILILATPVRVILNQLEILGQSKIQNPKSKIILDLGSTKSAITAAMQTLPANFDPLGGHPMCGKETGGIQNADPDLYRNKTFVLCPLERTSSQALALAHELIAIIGATPLILSAEQHDTYAALISHLPYTLAAALMRTALANDNPALWQMAASGFRDTTRLAASDLTMITDVLLTNRTAVLESLTKYKAELDSLTTAIESGDAVALHAVLESAQRKRSELFK
jgi:prephenate dehydrogenase